MDIDALLDTKNKLVETLQDDVAAKELLPNHKETMEAELDELLELERDLGMDLEEASRNGIYFIDEDYFEDYAQELAHDLGLINANVYEWPYNCIDWTEAADELKADYTDIEFQGNPYLVRI